MLSRWIAALVAIAACGLAQAQGAVSQLLSGDLVNPRTGVWAWYELEDAESGEMYYLKQSIVGETREDRKVGHWLEVQVRPQVGFSTTYKMLLTGPATDPSNIKRIYFQTGTEPIQKLEPTTLESPPPGEQALPEPQGEQTVQTPNGPLVCKIYKMPDGAEMWLSDAVPPMGIVRIKSREGELRLQRYGEGGPEAETALVTDEDEKSKKKSREKDESPEDSPSRPANALPLPDQADGGENSGAAKTNFKGKRGKP